MTTDIEIARNASPLDIREIASKLKVSEDALVPFGRHKAKIKREEINLDGHPDGKLILVTAISPTPAGEGKTTTTVGLSDGINALGKKAVACLREPSLGPCFGMKGGAAGGGYAQVIPMEDINLHFTGDFHAIGAAHNLLAALMDNQLYWGNALDMNPRSAEFKRVLDMNDRSLRQIVSGLGKVNGSPMESGFDITVASEVMAIFCLAENFADLKERLGKISLGTNRKKERLYAKDISAEGAMTVLLKEAFSPNLVQTLENNPALIHGGPFANIAHGCNSVAATKLGLKLADYVVTEAGFGADLGAEKFFDIKCAKSGLRPDACVLVATVRALKMHGGVAKENLTAENVEAVKKGLANLFRHAENLKKFGVPVAVGINHFVADTQEEIETVLESCRQAGIEAKVCRHWAEGGNGIRELAEHVCALADSGTSNFSRLYAEETPLADKIQTICREIYRASQAVFSTAAKRKIERFQEEGYGHFPICMAKTQYSFSNDPKLLGAPEGFEIEIKDVMLNTGAEFLVALAGDIMRMPGLPRIPAANSIYLDESGNIQGLF